MEERKLNSTERVLEYITSNEPNTPINQSKLARELDVPRSLVERTTPSMKCFVSGQFIGKRCEDRCPWAKKHKEQPNASVCPSTTIKS